MSKETLPIFINTTLTGSLYFLISLFYCVVILLLLFSIRNLSKKLKKKVKSLIVSSKVGLSWDMENLPYLIEWAKSPKK